MPDAQTVYGDGALIDALDKALEPTGLSVRPDCLDHRCSASRDVLGDRSVGRRLACWWLRRTALLLSALGRTRNIGTCPLAHITKAIDHDARPFHKGAENSDMSPLTTIARIALSP